MSDELDLTIGVSVQGAEQAKAAVGTIPPEITAIKEAATAATTAVGQMAVEMLNSGKVTQATFDSATTAVDKYAASVAVASKAVPNLVPPAALSAVSNYKSALNDVEAAVVKTVPALEKGAKGVNVLGVEATVARGNVGGLARAFATLGGPIAEVVLPLLAFEGLLRLFPQLGKAVSDTFEEIKVSIGGTSKNVETMVADFVKARKTLSDAGVAGTGFKTVVDLMAAAGLKLHESFTPVNETYAELVARMGAADAAMIQSSKSAVNPMRDAFNELVRSIDALRVDAPATAEALTAALIKMAQTGAKPTSNEFLTLKDNVEKARQEQERHAKQMESEYGPAWKNVREAVSKFSADIDNARDLIQKATAAGVSHTEIVKGLKGPLSDIAAIEEKYGGEIARINPELNARVQAIKSYWKELQTTDPIVKKMIESEEAHRTKVVDLAREYDKLEKGVLDSIAKMRQAYADDVKAVDARTDKTVADIHTEEETLRKQWLDGVIGQDQYRQNMDRLISAQLATVANATAEKDKLNKSEQRSEEEKAEAFVTASGKIKEQLTKEGKTLEEAHTALAAYAKSQEAVVAAQKQQLETLIATKAPHETLNKIVKEGTAGYKGIHAAIGGVVKQTNAYAKSAAGVSKAHAAIAKSSPFRRRT
jgi:hypothetical protein